MKTTLTKPQLQDLTKIIFHKGINYDDLLEEMTDHIASEVEVVIDAEGVDYFRARKTVFARYGSSHFKEIDEEKIKQIEKKSLVDFRKNFISFFTIPKVVITLFMFFSFRYLFENEIYQPIKYYMLGAAILLFAGMYYFKHKQLGSKQYLSLIKYNWGLLMLSQISIHLIFHADRLGEGSLLPSLVLTLSYLVILITMEIYVKQVLKLKRQLA